MTNKNEDRQQSQRDIEESRQLLGKPTDITLEGRTVAEASMRGQKVLVRSYGWSQLFEVLSAVQLMLDQLALPTNLGRPLTDVFAEHRSIVDQLISLSTGMPIEQIHALGLTDGMRLATAVWNENKHFFEVETTALLARRLLSGLKTEKSSSGEAPTKPQADEQPHDSLHNTEPGPQSPIG